MSELATKRQVTVSATREEPWIGLMSYGEDDQGFFFGRDREVAELQRLVIREQVTVIFGASGTGKSSLLNAGLFPKLRGGHFLPVSIRFDYSAQTSPAGQIRAAVEEAVRASAREIEQVVLNDPLDPAGEETAWEYLHRTEFWDDRNQPITPVLVFDQFEEVFTLGSGNAATPAFLDELADLGENYIPLTMRSFLEGSDVKFPACYDERHYKIIITLREDFVSRLDGLRRAMPSIMHNRFRLQRMTAEQALAVVMQPGGDLVEDAVAREIVGIVAGSKRGAGTVPDEEQDFSELQVEPALLSLVCRELNSRRLKEGAAKITSEAVAASSEDILEDFYERSFVGLDESDREFVEDRLVTASGFRSTVPVEEAVQAGLEEDEITLLVDRRILRKEDRLGSPHLELTHDVLTRVVEKSRTAREERKRLEAQKRQQEEEAARERAALAAEVKRRQEELDLATARRKQILVWGIAGMLVVFGLYTWWHLSGKAQAVEALRDANRDAALAQREQELLELDAALKERERQLRADFELQKQYEDGSAEQRDQALLGYVTRLKESGSDPQTLRRMESLLKQQEILSRQELVISPEAFEMIVRFEGEGKAGYDAGPRWRGGASGVTIGIGYDLGYQSFDQIKADWGKHSFPGSDRMLPLLERASGTTGKEAAKLAKALSEQGVKIPYEAAREVFREVTLSSLAKLTYETYPGVEKLPPSAQGALLSLIMNRGTNLTGPSRLEMANIVPLVEKGDLKGIAGQIRKMKRIWDGKVYDPGIIARRDAEAELVLSAKPANAYPRGKLIELKFSIEFIPGRNRRGVIPL